MISREDLEEIKRIIKDFFDKTTIDLRVDFLPQRDSTLPVEVEAEEPQILIGQNGKTLSDIQHLLTAILRRRIKSGFYIDLDINGYKKKKVEYLKEMARSAANEVALTKTEKALPPMPAYERRVVHMELASRPDVTTESDGREPERRIIIKPSAPK